MDGEEDNENGVCYNNADKDPLIKEGLNDEDFNPRLMECLGEEDSHDDDIKNSLLYKCTLC